MPPKDYGSKATVFVDNESAIQFPSNHPSSSESEHIDVGYHFIWNEIRKENICVVCIKSSAEYSDRMTKGKPQDVLKRHRRFVLEM